MKKIFMPVFGSLEPTKKPWKLSNWIRPINADYKQIRNTAISVGGGGGGLLIKMLRYGGNCFIEINLKAVFINHFNLKKLIKT